MLENRNNEDTEKVEQEKTNILDTVSEDKEVEIIQLLESMKIRLNKLEKKLDALNEQVKGVGVSDDYNYNYDYDWDQFVIIANSLVGSSIVLDDFNDGERGDDNMIGIEAIVNGNGNQATFTGSAMYRKMGNRLEIYGNDTPILTNVSGEQFQEHFGLFPTVNCNAG